MGKVRRVTISFACGDSYAAAMSPQARLEVIEGTFNVQSQAATMTVQEATPSAAQTTGIQLSAGSFVGVGFRTQPGSGWRLDQTYFRNTTPGSNATIVFTGTVEDVSWLEAEA